MFQRACVVLGFGVALALAAGIAPAAEWGDLTGKFVYDGEPPTPAKLKIDADEKAFGKLGLVDESLVVDKKTRGIANIVVYVRTRDVEVHPDYDKAAKKNPLVRFDNKDARFVPRILPVWLGKHDVLLCNSDPVSHNSNVQPIGDDAANPLLPPKAEVEHKFNLEQIIPVPVSCNIHKWMRGYILPRSNPYVAVTGKDGSFKLANLPAGEELEFQVWQEKSGYVAQGKWKRGRFKLTVNAGKNDLGIVKVDPKLFEK